MSQQVLDVRRCVQIVRRHKTLVGIVVALGILVGGGYSALNPPMLTSTALVVLPQSVPSMATQVIIASSDPVLSAALPNIKPALSLDGLRSDVEIKSLTSFIMSVTATSKSATGAADIANAVAASYLAYVGSGDSPVGHLSVRILSPASNATGASPLAALLATGLTGALAGGLIGGIVSVAIGRKDPRLRARDDIANSIGIPVLASIPVGHPSNPAGWTKLLGEYSPAVVHAWRLRKALQQIGLTSHTIDNDSDAGMSSVTVLSLSCDPAALALGPQWAVFAASLGIPTALVIGPQQDTNVAASLRTACDALASAPPSGANQLRVTVCDQADADVPAGTAFAVVVAVVNERTPRVPDTMRTSAAVLGVSAGATTAEQLARVAVSAATDGRDITGILVADPEPNDNTTGQIPQLSQLTRRRLPTRLNGKATEIRR